MRVSQFVVLLSTQHRVQVTLQAVVVHHRVRGENFLAVTARIGATQRHLDVPAHQGLHRRQVNPGGENGLRWHGMAEDITLGIEQVHLDGWIDHHGLLIGATAFAGHDGHGHHNLKTYEVTITNITSGQSFTPVLVATHIRHMHFFELGEAPSQELADLAEGGATGPLQDLLDGIPEFVFDTQTTGEGLIGPGETKTIVITANPNISPIKRKKPL